MTNPTGPALALVLLLAGCANDDDAMLTRTVERYAPHCEREDIDRLTHVFLACVSGQTPAHAGADYEPDIYIIRNCARYAPETACPHRNIVQREFCHDSCMNDHAWSPAYRRMAE